MDAGNIWASLGLDISNYLSGMSEVKKETESTTDETSQKVGGIGGAFESIGGLIGSLGIAAAITGIGVEALEVVNKVDKLHAAFETFNGAGEETEKLFEDIGNLEVTSMFDFEDTLGPAAKTLLKFGMSAEDTTKTMGALVDTASAMKLDPSSIENLTSIFGRMNNETTLSAKSMKQLTNEIGTSGWEALAKSLGTDVKTAMDMVKEGSVSAKAAVGAITEGLADKFSGAAEATTHTWAGAMNQLDQATEDVMVALGRTLKDLLTELAPILETVVGWIKTAAEWFTNLPGPVKEFALVFAAVLPIAAAVGSALATMGPILTAVTAAFSWPVVAIAAVTAALVALALWVNDNWEPIMAVLTVAFDAVVTAWTTFSGWLTGWWSGVWNDFLLVFNTIFGPFYATFQAIWDTVATAWVAVWNGITSFFVGIWTGIKDTAASIWKGVTDAVASFLEFAKKIPGVNKLFDLDDAWNSAKKLKEETTGAADAIKKVGEASGPAKTEIKALGLVIESKGAAAAKAKEASKQHAAALKEEKEAAKEAEKFHKFYLKTIEAKTKAAEKARTTDDELTAVMDKAALSLDKIKTSTDKVTAGVDLTTIGITDATAAMGQLTAATDPAVLKAFEYEAAMKALGFTSRAELQATADQADRNYKTIVASDQTTQFQKDSALIKLLEAQKAVAKAAGTDIAADQQAMLDKLNEQVQSPTTGLPKTESMFKTFGTSVSTIVTNFAQDIAKSLWEGDTSWGEKGKTLLKGLGEAVTSSFIEPATKVLNDFINGVIKDLIGGKGFGGVLDSITGLGDKFSLGGLFGGGTKTPAVPGVPAVPGTDAGGALGGIGGAAGSSLTGILTSVFSGVSAVTDVLSMFGVGVQGRIKELLGEIHNDTSYLAWNFDQGGLHDALLGHANNFAAYSDAFGGWFHDSLASLMTTVEYILPEAVAIRTDTAAIRGTLEQLSTDLTGWMSRPIMVQVQADGITTADAANILANQIAMNLSKQMASSTLR